MLIYRQCPAFALLIAAHGAVSLSLIVELTGGNVSSPLMYGLLYEDIYHSGDGGIYAELIRNRAFQGSNANGQASTTRNIDHWHPVGGVTLSIDTSLPPLSASLPAQLRMDVPEGVNSTVGFYNDGFWGFDVRSDKSYATSLYMRGTYKGTITCHFENGISAQRLSSTTISLDQTASDGWKYSSFPIFQPCETTSNPNNTFHFTFNGDELAGQSLYFNLLSTFKQTYKNRDNGLREDLALAVQNLGGKYLRFPGGNNMEGLRSPYYWKWNETIGPLSDRPGHLGTWGDFQTNGLGLLEQLQWALDMNLTPVLGVWAGLYLNGEVFPKSSFQSVVDHVLDELEFLLGDCSATSGGRLRASLGHSSPFNIPYVEIGNEDYLNNGTESYLDYRFSMLYNAIAAKYPNVTLISTINPSPGNQTGSVVDVHAYGNEAYFVQRFGEFDHVSREHPILVGEYAATNFGNISDGQAGAQTLSMMCAEAVYLLGCERNSDIVFGTSYGAFIKEYNEEPGTVAVIKHTANEVLLTMSYYLQQLFAKYHGEVTLPVTATDGGFGPVYWSAMKSSDHTILKLVNYNGTTGASSTIDVSIQGSNATYATLITLTAPDASSVNNLSALGGETSTIIAREISGSGGSFVVEFSNAYEVKVLLV